MDEDYRLNRLDFILLNIIYYADCKSHFNSMTINEIMDSKTDESGKCLIGRKMTLYNKLQKLVQHEYLKNGVKDAKANTYYIIEKGIKLVEKESKKDETKG